MNKSPYKSSIFSKSTRITTPLTIYTSPGCSVCNSAKELCNKKGIKYITVNRRDHSEYVKKETNNSKTVPNVFNFDGEYIGGYDDLCKLI
jgi:glutaredoxin